jgi:diaminohydroxyphosphoribosylaminopyrimidine deaminase/5-amino-6-(5-phosphoribosylamino)uracil reductase
MQRNDQYWMARALRQARCGLYTTQPNPRVGCVIVRDDQCLGEGFHQVAGGPHAEINALQAAASNGVDNATVYVTLEPCAHTGRTPPCSQALIKAGPKRVVVAMTDPNPLVAGRGIEQLRQAGIEVDCGMLQTQAEQLNRGFIKRMRTQRPFVRVKMASTLDGRSALANGVSQWVTGAAARRDVQFLRAQSSAVLSTAVTVIADDASLNVRLQPQELGQELAVRQPVRVVLDPEMRLTGREAMFSIDSPVWIFTANPGAANNQLAAMQHVELIEQGLAGEKFDLDAVMQQLAAREINEVHTECGAVLAGGLFQARLVDELVVYQSLSLFGNRARGLFELGEISIMSDRVRLALRDIRQVGDDIRLTTVPEY